MFFIASLLLVSMVTDRAQGQCWCFTSSGVNIRSSACGDTIIGSGSSGDCFPATGNSQDCDLDGTQYTFHEFVFGSSSGWAAGDFLRQDACPSTTTGSPTTTGITSPPDAPGECSAVTQVLRDEWEARDPSGTLTPLTLPVKNVFIHHTVGDFCYTLDECKAEMKDLQDFFMDVRGYSDMGYSWLVGEDGRAYEGRGWGWVGAHTQGCNTVSVAISLMGNFHAPEGGRAPNAAIMEAVKNLIDCAISEGVLVDWSSLELRGHRDSPCAATSCPGDQVHEIITDWSWFTTSPPSDPACSCSTAHGPPTE